MFYHLGSVRTRKTETHLSARINLVRGRRALCDAVSVVDLLRAISLAQFYHNSTFFLPTKQRWRRQTGRRVPRQKNGHDVVGDNHDEKPRTTRLVCSKRLLGGGFLRTILVSHEECGYDNRTHLSTLVLRCIPVTCYALESMISKITAGYFTTTQQKISRVKVLVGQFSHIESLRRSDAEPRAKQVGRNSFNCE